MRIIDDVLTLSKLDSMLLSVVPVDVQIHAVISQLMKIFQSELHVKGIISEFIVSPTLLHLEYAVSLTDRVTSSRTLTKSWVLIGLRLIQRGSRRFW